DRFAVLAARRPGARRARIGRPARVVVDGHAAGPPPGVSRAAGELRLALETVAHVARVCLLLVPALAPARGVRVEPAGHPFLRAQRHTVTRRWPKRSERPARMSATTKTTLATPAALAAMPPKPNSAATIAMRKKAAAQYNMESF